LAIAICLQLTIKHSDGSSILLLQNALMSFFLDFVTLSAPYTVSRSGDQTVVHRRFAAEETKNNAVFFDERFRSSVPFKTCRNSIH